MRILFDFIPEGWRERQAWPEENPLVRSAFVSYLWGAEKMRANQVIGSLGLALLLGAYLTISLNGGFMTGFGPSGPGDPHSPETINWNQIVMAIFAVVGCVIPIISLWLQSRVLVVIASIGIAPIFIVGVLCMMVPLLGLAILIPVLLWANAAHSQWLLLKNGGRSTSTTSDLEGTPWENDPGHTSGKGE